MTTLIILAFFTGVCAGAATALAAVMVAHDERTELPGDPSREWKEGK